MNKLTLIIFPLVFALLIQNTCPLGAAGKTMVAPSCDNRPSQNSFSVSSDGQSLVSDSSSLHFPLYVFAVPKTTHTFQLDLIQTHKLLLHCLFIFCRATLQGCFKQG